MRLMTRVLVPLAGTFVVIGAAVAVATYEVGRHAAIEQAMPPLVAAADQASRALTAAVDARDDALDAIDDLEEDRIEAGASTEPWTPGDEAREAADAASRTLFRLVALYDGSGAERLRFVNGTEVPSADGRADERVARAIAEHRESRRSVNESNGTAARTYPRVVESADGVAVVAFVDTIRDADRRLIGLVWAEAPVEDIVREAAASLPGGSARLYVLGPNATRIDGGVARSLPATVPTFPTTGASSAVTVVDDDLGMAFAFQRSARMGNQGRWVVVVDVSLDDVVAASRGALVVTVVGAVATLAALTAVVHWAISRALRPIEGMSRAIASIGSGDFSARLEPAGADELKTLAIGVNQMGEDLARRSTEREREADARVRLEKLATIGTLSAGVGHEVNNPLSILMMNLQMMHAELEDLAAAPGTPEPIKAWASEQVASVKANTDAAQRIKKIVASMRLLAKPQVEPGPVEVALVVEATLALAATRLRHRAKVEVDVPAGIVAFACADSLGQVMLNLVLNAADAVPADGGWIGVRAEARDGRVLVGVEDNGPGVPASVRERMFTPFVTTKAHGTGLGLSICHRIVAQNGGELRHEDRDGGGTRFVVDLPLATQTA